MSVTRELPRFSVPGSCIMFPGRTKDDRGFFLFDTTLDGANGDIRVGISGEGLRTIAKRHGERFGIIEREKYDNAVNVALELKNRVLELEEQVAELEGFKERIAGLAADGFKVNRKQGRPVAQKEGSE